jgi:hypothetical protein
MHKCNTCGYVGEKEHTDIYDCCDYVNPMWMMQWLKRMKITEKKMKPVKNNFKTWSGGHQA